MSNNIYQGSYEALKKRRKELVERIEILSNEITTIRTRAAKDGVMLDG